MHPELIGGRYRVVRAIGQGGMGTVWLCRDEKLQRDVAVKQVGLLPGQSVTDSARALREARSSAALSHRNVVTVFDVVEEDQAIWLVMEHVPSRSLSQLIKQEGALDPARVADIGAQVADGLAAAHAMGTMHRDVKPGNVLVRDDGLAKISDFGIARSAGDPALTQSGLLTGTPMYFSPELARGAAPSLASDVWALGATLYAAVEGHPPYTPHDNPVAVLHDIATKQPPAPVHAAFLEPVLLRTLDRDPDSRWTMADAAHALRRLAREHSPENTRAETLVAASPRARRPERPAPAAVAEPTTTPPSGPGPRDPVDPSPSPPSRRRWVYAALAALALLVVVAGVVYAVNLGSGSADKPAASTASRSPSTGGSPSARQSASSSPTRSTSPSTSSSTSPTPSSTPSPSQSTSSSSGASSSPSATASATSGSGGGSGSGTSKAAFLRRYFAVAPGGTAAGWSLLGPGEKAQGRGPYNAFWRGISSVDVRDIRPLRGSNSVELTITYHETNGSTSTERQRLDLVRSSHGGYLINNDDVIG
jgi:eukaryotic-like serine/threonine-protein kinase